MTRLALRFNWSPLEAAEFYLDEVDECGLFYWENILDEEKAFLDRKYNNNANN